MYIFYDKKYFSVTLGQYGESSMKKDEGIVFWELIDVRNQTGSKVNGDEIIPALKEALLVYGYSGVRRQLSNYSVNFKF